jgi:hypothetical protein
MDSSKKLVLMIKSVDIDKVHSQYKIGVVSNIPSSHPCESSPSQSVTALNDIVSSFNESSLAQNNVKMVQWNSRRELSPNSLLKCFWCRHCFDGYPIGCPVRFVPSKIQKTYHSEITKDNYCIKENISDGQKNTLCDTNSKIAVELMNDSYYETDGIFCSFNCCLAFIYENSHNPFYKLSTNFLANIYTQSGGKDFASITRSPHWRSLKDYGGFMSLSEYRSCFNHLQCDMTDFYKPFSTIFISNSC